MCHAPFTYTHSLCNLMDLYLTWKRALTKVTRKSSDLRCQEACRETVQDIQTEYPSLLFLRFIIRFCLLLFGCSHFTNYFIYEFFFAILPIPLHLRYFQRLPVLLYLSLSHPFISSPLSLSYLVPFAIHYRLRHPRGCYRDRLHFAHHSSFLIVTPFILYSSSSSTSLFFTLFLSLVRRVMRSHFAFTILCAIRSAAKKSNPCKVKFRHVLKDPS